MNSAKTKSVENGIMFKYSIVGGDIKGIIEFADDKKTELILLFWVQEVQEILQATLEMLQKESYKRLTPCPNCKMN